MKVHSSSEEQKKGLERRRLQQQRRIASFFRASRKTLLSDAIWVCVCVRCESWPAKNCLAKGDHHGGREFFHHFSIPATHTRCGLQQIKVFLFLERLASERAHNSLIIDRKLESPVAKQILTQSPSRWVLRSNCCWMMCMICYCIMATYLLIAHGATNPSRKIQNLH